MKIFQRIGLFLTVTAALLMSFGTEVLAQSQTVKGVVIDENGEPISFTKFFVVYSLLQNGGSWQA